MRSADCSYRAQVAEIGLNQVLVANPLGEARPTHRGLGRARTRLDRQC